MNEPIAGAIGFLLLAAIEGFNGVQLAFRARRTLRSAGIAYEDGSGLLVQEFGFYSLGIAAAYVIAASDPARFWGVALAGIAINLSAGAMHLLRSIGIYLGDAKPVTSAAAERTAGCVHAMGLLFASALATLAPADALGADTVAAWVLGCSRWAT